jgi:uncharacterized protein Yka (UPF0111/DUF47 family)
VALIRRETDVELLDLYELAGRNVLRGARLLHELLVDYPERTDLAGALKDCEHDGDRITHDIIHRLRCGHSRPPVDLADGHALAAALDDVVDDAEQAADWLGLYAVEAPMEPAIRMAEVLVAASGALVEALAALRANADMGPHLVEVNRLEDECDRLHRDGVASLFVAGIDPMVVIRWKDIFASIEAAVDGCETVAHVLEGISLKRRAEHRLP